MPSDIDKWPVTPEAAPIDGIHLKKKARWHQ